MTRAADWPIGLARVAAVLGHDLQRAAREAGGPAALWSASRPAFARALRADAPRTADAEAVRQSLGSSSLRADLARRGVRFFGRPEPGFPSRLCAIYDPPFGIFALGAVDSTLAALGARPVVAVVGSRRATAAGRAMALSLARGLAERNAVIVSGLAVGIDGAAHEGALAGGGLTVAVTGCGVDVSYPRAHRVLARRIAADGVLLSEYWPGTRPAPWRFPARNRLVAALADAVVVVEAGRRSGSLITADFALEAGHPVLAVPGAAGSEAVAGCHALIREGAALCESVADVIAETASASWSAAQADRAERQHPGDGIAGQALRALRTAPRSADELAGELAVSAAELLGALATLEVDGHAVRGEAGVWWAAPEAIGAA